jgi:hypothetical protein
MLEMLLAHNEYRPGILKPKNMLAIKNFMLWASKWIPFLAFRMRSIENGSWAASDCLLYKLLHLQGFV